MKFVATGTRHPQNETFDDIRRDADEGTPRYSPSYYETAKKARETKKKG